MRKKHFTPKEIEAVIADERGLLGLPARLGLLASTDGTSNLRQKILGNLGHAELVELARQGDNDADALLRGHALIGLRSLLIFQYDGTLPPVVKQSLLYACLVLANQIPRRARKRGRDVFSNLDRDERILQSVTRVVQRGFAPTRSHVSKDKGQVHSACSIVAATLHQLGINIAENAIEAIWRKRNKKGWDTVISEWTVRKK